MPIAAGKQKAPVLAFFALVFVVFTCVFPYIGSLNNPNENVRTFMTMAIVEDHTFRIDSIVQRHGWVNDMAKAPEKGTNTPHLYSVKAPATSYSGVPFYWAFTKLAPHFGHPIPTPASAPEAKAWWLRNATFVMRLFAVQLPCFAFLVWFERWLRLITKDEVLRLTAVAAVGLGTNYLGYALMFASHATFAASAFMAFGITYRARIKQETGTALAKSALGAGFFASLATHLEYHAFPVSVVLTLYALATFYKPKPLAFLTLGGAVNMAGMMFFQWKAFGSPFTPGHRMAENARFHEELNKGLFGLEKPNFQVFKDLSLSHAFGFFGLSPYMWLGLLAIPLLVFIMVKGDRLRREQATATGVWLSAMLILWVAVSAANNWRGGWTIGPRYLGGAPPFFAFGAVCALDAFAGNNLSRRALARGLAGGLAFASALSIGVVGLHLNTLPDGNITRPLVQFTLPMARVGFVPYHLGNLLGSKTATFWYVVCACLVVAALTAALMYTSEGAKGYASRVVAFAAAATVGLMPAWSAPVQPGEAPAEASAQSRFGLSRSWEPTGEDRITELHKRAADPATRQPCDLRRAAELERMVSWLGEAAADEKRSPESAEACK